MLVERAYAKINLTLDVMGKRNDGYHEVDMVMQTVDLSDSIWLETVPGEVISVDSTASHIPLDGRNLAVIAAQTFMAQTGLRRGLRVTIDKQIPVAAGLAGGSADAAAVLRGLNRLYQTGLTMNELARIGASIGSDVPFCVHGGCAVARGRGERIEQVAHHVRAWVVLIRPPVFVSTADVYGALPVAELATNPSSSAMVRALQEDDFMEMRRLVTNGLAATTARLYPEVGALRERVEQVTGQKVFMSGSGPTLFCLVPTQSAGQRIYNALRGFIREVYLCRFV